MITARPDFSRILKALDRHVLQLELMHTGRNIRDYIKTRTLSGRDKHNRRFEAYTADYARRKRGLPGGGNIVNMVVSGRMLEAITVKDEMSTGIPVVGVYITGKYAELAHIHNTGAGNQPKREFFGLTPAGERRFGNEFMQRISTKAGF